MKQKRSVYNRAEKRQIDSKEFPLKKVETELEVDRKSNTPDVCTDTCSLNWKPNVSRAN